MHKSLMYKRALELKRELYESWLTLTICLLLQWNEWHLLVMVNCPDRNEHCKFVKNVTFAWSRVFFNLALLLAISPLWPATIRGTRLVLLPLKLAMLLYASEWLELEMWQPFLGIIEHMLHAVAHAERMATFFYYWPSLANWLMQDAFHVVRFVASFSFFLLAINAAGPNWRRAIDFLLLGRLPETPEIQRLMRRAQHLRLQAQQMGQPIELSAQELISRRMCDVYIQCFH